ncbi:hypothetical protein HF313_19590 [Massilia atriviolacea]|uniref:Peptidase C58 YopT-type domain-containing protein n=1 Tax=Massilia atriviolacea TaxID=2495579 RepID=A0A430HSP8_9BURK|nr:hypothetical protein [Massilia atriviolacea]RSZ60494.1 hypothetical protein EJB06_05110 [Massilia atriviolacea]
MALKNIYGCKQSVFDARKDGSCWGISIDFCRRALDHGALQAIASMVDEKASVAEKAELYMKAQDSRIHAVAKPMFIPDTGGEMKFGATSLAGQINEGIAIQLRHNVVQDLIAAFGIKNIGTLTSFYEGGTETMIQRLISLSRKAGKTCVMLDLQNPSEGHSVVLSYEAPAIYFFDSNEGLFSAEMDTVAADLTKRFECWQYTFAHLLVKK